MAPLTLSARAAILTSRAEKT
uniref:Uncharacterized protein n=1 Tax=Anguilla anguilla TaxID=7936 RepID=A0A0E9Q839_ANGAN